jgi:DnaJ-class molecular chaperone
MTDVQECRRCNGSGEIAVSAATCRFVAPGPVPDDAKGVAVATCDECSGMGYVENGED